MTKNAAQPVNAKHTFRRLLNIQAADSAGAAVAPAEVELLQTGEWDAPWHGHFEITPADLLEYVKHFNDGVRKGVPIDREHMSSSEQGASGWIESLSIKPTANPAFTGQESLWGAVSWTPAGEQKIVDREFRFFSPEFADLDYQDPETGEYMNNVLIGGGLTNRPLFKNLTAIAASDNNGNSKKGLTANSQSNTIYLKQGNDTTMNLQDLLAKATADLTDEEKAFIVEHKAELTDEQVTTLTDAKVLEAEADGDGDGAGDGDGSGDDDGAGAGDGDGGADDGADGGDGAGGDGGNGAGAGTQASEKPVTIKASELAELRANATAGKQASEQLARKASEEHVATLCFSDTRGADQGKLPIAAKDKITDFYHGLNGAQRKAFDGIVAAMPSLKMFSQASQAGAGTIAGSAASEVKEKATAMLADEKNKGLTMGSAVRKVLASDKALAARYNEEKPQRGEQ